MIKIFRAFHHTLEYNRASCDVLIKEYQTDTKQYLMSSDHLMGYLYHRDDTAFIVPDMSKWQTDEKSSEK